MNRKYIQYEVRLIDNRNKVEITTVWAPDPGQACRSACLAWERWAAMNGETDRQLASAMVIAAYPDEEKE